LTGATSTATGTVLTLSDTQNVASVNVILDNEKALRFREATANGTNFVGLKAPATLASDLTLTLPSADGTSGQVLQTNGSGVLSFSSPSSDFVLLATTDASSSSSISFDGYFSSTYKNYQILCSNLTVSANYTTVRARFRRSNADVTSSNYYYVGGRYYIVDANMTAYGSTADNHIGFLNENTASTSGFNSSFMMYLYDPLGTNNYKNITYHSIAFDNGADNRHHWDNGSGGLTGSTSALSGITFSPASGTITRGNFKLYGIK
jgi:hypothetical protein